MSHVLIAVLSVLTLVHGQTADWPCTLPNIPLVLDNGFWFGNFTVGESTDLSLIIDTGSALINVDPGLYQPSTSSVNLHKNQTENFLGTQPNGCGFAAIETDAYADIAGVANLVVRNQTFGYVVPVTPPNNYTITKFQHDGIIGFSASPDSYDFIKNLYSQKQIEEERFGLALKTDGIGRQIFGGVEKRLLKDELTVFDLAQDNTEWILQGGLPGEIGPDSYVYIDSGTANVVGAPDLVKTLFTKLGIQYVEQDQAGCQSSVIGYYPCDNPPKVAFQFGISNRKFYIEPDAFKLADNGNNNCTATITGIEYPDPMPPFNWTIGQSFFQGKYVDFNVGGNQIGFADLRI